MEKFIKLLVAVMVTAFMFIGCSDDGDGDETGGESSRYTVIFNLNGGVGNATTVNQTVASGQTATRPASNPTRDGYVFDNWYTSQTDGSVYDFSTPITANITIFARWTQNNVINPNLPVNPYEGQMATTDLGGGVSMEVIFVTPGTFRQGACAQNNVNRIRDVTLTRGFWIGKYPVTQAQYQAVMGTNPSALRGNPNNPVERVSWNDVTSSDGFLARIGGRLPTEAEWEFAARGGNRSQGFIYSGSDNLSEVGWFLENSNSSTQAVGQLKSNELGIHDMSGNVWEWVSDWLGSFGTASVTDPTGPSEGSNRLIRGGSFWNSAESCRVALGNFFNPEYRMNNFGFRVVFSAN